MRKKKRTQALEWAYRALPLSFFAALLFSRLSLPREIYFDEVHYVPAAKALITLTANLNWVHPPLGKALIGASWLVFGKLLHLLAEPASFRVAGALFGLWALAAIGAWMRELGYELRAQLAAVWLTGFNFLWFVQSKIAMLDIFCVAFGLWGLLWVKRLKCGGGVLLGLAVACKWSAISYVALALAIDRRRVMERVAGIATICTVYAATFMPLALLKKGAMPFQNIVSFHRDMLGGFGSIASAEHPYASHWWQWPALLRPIWFLFETGQDGRGVERCVWAGGNPVLFGVALPLLVVVVFFAIARRDAKARFLAALYWVPMLFWAVAPRKLQLYYYYIAPSMFVGPIVVWAHERFLAPIRRFRGWMLIGFVLLSAATFIYFLPIMDGRPLQPEAFRRWMWFEFWI